MEINVPNFNVTMSTKTIPNLSTRKILVHSLTEAQKEIFLKYLKYDIQVATGNVHESLIALMVIELNGTNTAYSKTIWLRLLKSWTNYIKSSDFTGSPCDNTFREMLNDELIAVQPSTFQLSCILNHLIADQNSPTVWKRISIALSSGHGIKTEDYWKRIFAAAKTRTMIKAQLLQSLQCNQMEITDDLQMTEIENRILQHEKSSAMDPEEINSIDQCRVCLEYGNGFLSLFHDLHETPSTIDKLMECSRISQVDSL
ncbi:hypothetical protein HA402_002791 [Bradysia odoriphaga]|nr:hypothetical protein HA402_002791 [Bradysia odoriphaga]